MQHGVELGLGCGQAVSGKTARAEGYRHVIRITSGVTNIRVCGYAGGRLNIMTHITVFNRVLVIQFNVKILFLLRHDNISPVT